MPMHLSGRSAGTVFSNRSHPFLVTDTVDSVKRLDETNNTGQGNRVDGDDITYFSWDFGQNGTITRTDAIHAIQAIGTADRTTDADHNGVVTRSNALVLSQRLGYEHNRNVYKDSVLSSVSNASPLASVPKTKSGLPNVANPAVQHVFT